jgi:hypothetical protein
MRSNKYPTPDDVRDFHWRDRVPYSTTVVAETDVAISHAPSSAVAILFQTLIVDLQGQSADLGAATIAAMSLPLEPGRSEPTPLRCQIRGSALVQPGARGVILVQLGNETAAFSFTEDESNFIREIEMMVKGGESRPFPVTVVVTATRPTTSTVVRMEVDAIDCSVAFGAPVS